MQYKATVSFTGLISMAMGEVREISDPLIVEDLLNAGHIIAVEADKKPKTRAKKGKSNED